MLGVNKSLSAMAKVKVDRLNRKKQHRKKIHGMLLDRESEHEEQESLTEEEREQLRRAIQLKTQQYTKSEKQARLFIYAVFGFITLAIILLLL